MSQTTIPVGSPLSKKIFGAALFAHTQRQSSMVNSITGPAPSQSDAEAKLRGQSSPDMPAVRVTDLTKSAGDKITVDLINVIGGKPIVGDRMAEGKGEKMSFSTMEVRIDLMTKGVDAGGKMAQQRTVHQLRGLAMANLKNYFRRLFDQQTVVHLAGARGYQNDTDWVVPLASDEDFGEIMINDVVPPTFNRHFVVDGNALVQGGQQLSSIDATDTLRLEHIDEIATIIDDSQYKLQPVRIEDDPAKDDEPLYVLYVTSRVWNAILTNTTGQVWRTFLQNAWNRKSYGSKHPLFTGETGMWRNILFKRTDRAIRFFPGNAVSYCTSAGVATAATASVNVAAMAAGNAVDRCVLLGAQALAHVYGKNQSSETYASWLERRYNFDRNLEVAGETMGGKAKLRFDMETGLGTKVPTDHGVIAIDCAVKVQV